MSTIRQKVALQFTDAEKPYSRKRMIGKGFSTERVVIERNSPFDYKWSGATHYLALHNLRLADGETFLDGERTSRLCDLGNRMTFIPSGSVISGWSAPKKHPNSFTALYFRHGEMSDELSEHYGSCDLFPSVYFEDAALLATMQKLSGLLVQPGADDQIYAESLGLLAVMELLRMQKAAPKQRAVSKGGLSLRQQTILREYIEDFLHTDISLSDLAGVVGLTRFHFARAFAVTFGEPPHRYVSRRRIDLARQLLQDTSLGINEIAEKVGLKTATMLSRHMRKLVGVTPSQFRRDRPL
ncbi:helix-turn-helix domain-containing protein [Bradyrhizobium sp.]|uniref:helix-turn-helix domain-containing protein n=1 Tax=Bradyrhizobium sp. TaxID=376 RepID=UPI003C5C4DA8